MKKVSHSGRVLSSPAATFSAQHRIPSQLIASETCKHYYECFVDRQPSGLGSIILFTLWMSG